ncbi:hypothetical protein HJG54_32855 [Leptolyngbya sp. NK1-12]|uniref:HypX (Modular protein) n=1 Tax=Leptolyngbya sp. NK1-12 TaxID=2547451 RepID=A0AA96WZ81_9CYAN|nr:hypothetical protein [Leptolyngbya sp. NK1-12]WNZ27642.1 hypothetical protein HJG54_32855 [Leptolyngbya sp. NK1-12]
MQDQDKSAFSSQEITSSQANLEEADRSRRDQDDQNRDKAVYEYLLSLSDLDLSVSRRGKGKKDHDSKDREKVEVPTPNESSLAKQWGVERIFIRRVLRSVLYETYYAHEKKEKEPVPGLTLGKLIKILTSLQIHRKQLSVTDQKVPRILTRAEKLRALQKFFQLSTTERETLDLPVHPAEVLLQRLFEDATDPIKGMQFENAVQLYTSFLQQSSLLPTLETETLFPHDGDRKSIAKDLIRETVIHLINPYFNESGDKRKQEKTDDLVEKVEREISRIEFQAGIKQAEFFLGNKLKKEIQQKYAEYLTPQFVKRLARSVVENEILTDEFPIYLKYFEVEKVRPLPLYVKAAEREIGLLNPALLEHGEDEDRINGLERQVAYKVKVHFYIKLPDEYEVAFPHIMIIRQESGYRRLDFSEEITGIGSPLSHIIAVINRILFWDIPAIKDYLPIPDEVLNHDESVGGSNHSPVWSYSLVRLYKFDDIDRAILQGKKCEQVAESPVVAYGEFCGFDLVEVAANAALHARLRVIQQLGVDPKQYLKELCYRVEEREALMRAKSRLSVYPFSLRAMEGELEQTIFNSRYRRKDKDFAFVKQEESATWSFTAYDAHLEIAEANLKEGLYRVAKKYLEAVQDYFNQNSIAFLGNAIYAKYHFCLFRYAYLSDLDDPECPYPDRYQAVRAAESQLEEAQKCLDRRLEKYCKLNELPQSNFHPHFHLLSRLYAHQAKLYIFFPAYTREVSRWNSLLKALQLLEKARICAARDGDPTLYAQWSAYQSWCYLMLAYRSEQSQFPDPEFSQDKCIDWAKRLISHALLCYSSTGKTCYQQIKDNGGKVTEDEYDPRHSQSQDSETLATGEPKTRPIVGKKYYESYGKTKVQIVPLIQELSGESGRDAQIYDVQNNMLSLDMSLLKEIRPNDWDSVYLFGSISSIILFAMGMLELCEELQNRQQLLQSIEQKALRMFTYCWAIASDGTERNPDSSFPEDAIVLDRVFEDATFNQSGDLLLRGLYPHRLTQFADLGKIFVAVCKLLLVISDPSVERFYTGEIQQWDKVNESVKTHLAKIVQLMAELRSNNNFPTPETLGQQRYNGHLAEHFKNVEQYFSQLLAQLKSKQLKSLDIIDNRNKIVANIFEIIRGYSDITS